MVRIVNDKGLIAATDDFLYSELLESLDPLRQRILNHGPTATCMETIRAYLSPLLVGKRRSYDRFREGLDWGAATLIRHVAATALWVTC